MLSEYHASLIPIPVIREVSLRTMVTSEDNKSHLMTLLVRHFEDRLTNFDDPIYSQLVTNLDAACKDYMNIHPGRRYINNIACLKAINTSLLSYVINKIPKRANIIDPLWAMKGPGFKVEVVGTNRHPLMQIGVLGEPILNPRVDPKSLQWSANRNWTNHK